MALSKGFLFHNRYVLEESLGVGASAEVWKARDAKANNLVVALKIFTEGNVLDSRDLMDFQREFTTVYNIKHSNLLPPTGYDICDGRPYLIMQYCENGSCSCMLGRADEKDIIKFLHDVAAGLECLHDHNIIHLDIKPDNILLDDSLNFQVTDFGISVSERGNGQGSEGMSGGTRAYMSPERFEGNTTRACDIWALGATAVELLTGNAPYGEHGGLLQAQGEPLPELPDLQPEVKSIILSCLTADPYKRIKANELRQKIELYWETKSWTQHSNRNLIAYGMAAVASVIVCIGIFLWDYNRTKVRYYKDYTEYWGVPKGFGWLSIADVHHKEYSYRMEYSQGKLRRSALVNSAGKVVRHSDTEYGSRYPEVRFFYTDDGKLDYKEAYNEHGDMLYKMDYDEKLKTMTFRQSDEFGTEMFLSSEINNLYRNQSSSSLFDEKSNIARYLLTFDDNGLLIEQKYAGLMNVQASDENGIYGMRYAYDSKDRLTRISYLGADGSLKGDSHGMATRVYAYDDDNNWISVTYLNAEGEASHDGQNCSIVKLSYDKYGNRSTESYFDFDNKPSVRADEAFSSCIYKYDTKGNNVLRTYLDVNGNQCYVNSGFAAICMSYNENGFLTREELLDTKGKLIYSSEQGYAFVDIERDDSGRMLCISSYDEAGKSDLIDRAEGYSRCKYAYDSRGNIVKELYFEGDGKAAVQRGPYCGVAYEFDNQGRCKRLYYINEMGETVPSDDAVAEIRFEYNSQGALTKLSWYDEKGKLVANYGNAAGYAIVYDNNSGLKISETYFDVKAKPVENIEGVWKEEYSYDNGYLTKKKYSDVKGREVRTEHWRYDSRGNQVKSWTTENGKLPSGQVVTNIEYDANNYISSYIFSDLSGKKVNRPGSRFSVIKWEYDSRGNETLVTFWDANGRAAVDDSDTHRRVKEYNGQNQYTREVNYGTDGKPTTKDAEGVIKYDNRGNMIELACYDGYGKAALSSSGYHICKWEYEEHGYVTKVEYFGLDGKAVMNKAEEYAKKENVYDRNGNEIIERYYNTKKCFRVDSTKYNSRGQMTEWKICDANGRLNDDFMGFSRMTFTYEDDMVTNKQRNIYYQNGSLAASQTWNRSQNSWNQSTGGSGGASSWLANVRSDAADCPMEVADGVYLQSITYSSSSVTVTIKLANLTKYDVDDEDLDELKALVPELKSGYVELWDLPRSVTLKVTVTDRANRTVLTE